jgi:hypothetical protein
MERLEDFNDKYTLGTLDFNDMVWYLDYTNDKYDPSSLLQLGYSYKDEISVILYFFDKNGEETEQMTCEIETMEKVIRFKFDRYNYIGEEKPHRHDDFNPIRIRKRSKGYKNFMKWWNEFYEKIS